MHNLLHPGLMVNSLYDINPEELKQKGIRGVIFDLDNTIIPWGTSEMCPQITEWIRNLLNAGFKISLVSNNKQRRVQEIAERFDIPFVARACKPAKTGFRQAVAAMNLNMDQVAVVGDQLFTDILGGNRLGLFTIWVLPLSSREFIGTKIHRFFEKLAVCLLFSKNDRPRKK
ncbi:mitochondrial pgp phosphatase [Lucifera butyrica]|uniref:Mitochondrial pgp phosphatase n=1 Tax=Lucifera butyrica TaxID=1351585 RepID=A0A498R9D7_9FIRM|nr:YqeG family HAD IIIA-type phosphatase [Lucifera butyrica]VBB06882.1 mitochondrial pgp phosphatase [Lucifera butyrica]